MLTEIWEKLYSVLDSENKVMLATGFLAVVVYWGNGLLQLARDIYFPDLMINLKIQKNHKFQVKGSNFNPPLKDLLTNLLVTQFFIFPIAIYLLIVNFLF